MDKDLNESDCSTSQEDGDKSLVGKFKKNVSEIISNTPLSKWFRKASDTPTSTIRRREEDSDDEVDFQDLQPPTKRTKLPPTKEALSLNVSEVISPISSLNNVKKPLYKHFPEPLPGPSGYQTRKMLNSTSFTTGNNFKSMKIVTETKESIFKNPKVISSSNENSNITKENHSDSEDSTSGYSSGRVGSKEIVSQDNSKQTSPLENSPSKTRSLFQNSDQTLPKRSISPNRNSSLSSRMPTFNPSTFGSTAFIDRTLSTRRILSSPFYNGHTIYGGASAYGRNSKREPQDFKKVLRQSVKIKPVNKDLNKGNLQLGKTARRILDTLEQYSSPVSDAKKIPISSRKIESGNTLKIYIGANPYTRHRESHTASNKELQVPSVTDLLKIKLDQQKTKLQNSTEAVRQIATKSKSVLNEETYQITVHNEKEKQTTGKMKTRISSIRQRRHHVDDTVPEVKLNPVALPIKELPKFDIVVPPPSQIACISKNSHQSKPSKTLDNPLKTNMFSNKSPESTVTRKPKESASSDDVSMDFKFSDPLVLAQYLKPIEALNNFKFSEPLIKKRRSIHPELGSQEIKTTDNSNLKKNNGEHGFVSKKDNNNIKMEDSKALSLVEKFKPKEGTWECSAGMIRNQSDKRKCVECETPRKAEDKLKGATSIFSQDALVPVNKSSFGEKFKPPSNTWECPSCMIRNKDVETKCVACGTKASEKTPHKVALNSIVGAPSNSAATTSSFGIQFKAPAGTWECSTCMIRNGDDLLKCAACESPKPGVTASLNISKSSGFGSQFAPPLTTWECATCMIRNKNELEKCEACETPKPGNKIQASGSFGAEFKMKTDEWKCEVCLVPNKANATKCLCCETPKLGSSKSSGASITAEPSKISQFNFGIDQKTATGFTFGINPGTQLTQTSTNASLVFGEKRVVDSQKPATFSFGITKTNTTTDQSKSPATSSSKTLPLKTSETKIPDQGTKINKSESDAQPKTTTTTTFKFGGAPSKTEESTQNKSTPTFTFGKPSSVNNPSATPKLLLGLSSKPEGKSDIKSVEPPKVNPLLKANEKLPEKATVAPSEFSFGLSKLSSSPSVSSTTKGGEPPVSNESPSKRSKPSGEAVVESPKVPTFTFKSSTSNGDVTFPKSTGTSQPSAEINFNFGSSKTPAPATTAPVFGSTVSEADSSKTNNLFKFGGASSEHSKPTNGFTFGSSAPVFGAKDPVKNSTEVKPFSFKAPDTTSTAAFTTPKATLFQFASATSENKPAAAIFSSPAPQENKSQFTFGGSSAPSFGFGQSSNATPSFEFGSSVKKRENPFATENNTQQQAKQAATSNGMFNFGSGAASSQSQAGFSFGATASGTSSAMGSVAQSSGFNFGAGASAPAPGGFNFSGPPPSFDANAKPTFNFSGGGIPTFSAPPSQESGLPQRKIKKAVRRTGR